MFRKWSLVGLFAGLALASLHSTLWSSTTKNTDARRTPALRSDKARQHKQMAHPKGTLIRGGEVWTATGQIIKEGDVFFRGGRIVAVGQNLKAPGADVIDARGKFVTPGLIDTHSHMGVYPYPRLRGANDINETTRPVTADISAEHGFWPQDPAIPRAAAGGATTAQILPGSANLIAGRAVVIKLRVSRSVDDMKFPRAPYGLKMACGENPKRAHKSLRTRMGSFAGYRKAFQRAREYRRRWQRYEQALAIWKQNKARAARCLAKQKAASQATGSTQPASRPAPGTGPARARECKVFSQPPPKAPHLDHAMETLKQVLAGKILVHIHCYRADDMLGMIRLSKEFGFHIRSFHHATDAYKIRDVLAKEGISVSTWADWWGFRLEAFDAIQENAAMLAAAGVRVNIHSDSSIGIQRLNHEAAKAYYRGRAMGLALKYDDAIRWITINPAWTLGIDHHTGSLEPGKMADVVIWDGHPFRVRTRTHMVFIDGQQVFHRGHLRQRTDFEVGLMRQ